MRGRRAAKLPANSRSGTAYKSQVQVVAIGASAGGLDAFSRFFKAMPATSGLAFVLIQHFDPDHASHMAELLSRHTTMKVREADHLTRIQSDCVYVIPPNRSMSIRGGRLHLSVPEERRGMRTPIDHFFCSLADDRGERSVCIIMSSTGSDGVIGLRAVKSAGGMCMVQDPATAQYGDMPRAAVATGLVDYVLPVERMPSALLSYLSHSYISGPSKVRPGSDETEETLARIQELLRIHTSHDFRFYKRGTLFRRIERRMGLNQIHKISDYLALLRKKPAEGVLLSKDLMIGVTSFFRDPEAFLELRDKVIPSLVRNRDPESPIRVWVPGCATGEEAYSVAILILEELAAQERANPLQIFATDIDDDALQFAQISHYPESIAEAVSPDRLKRYFTRTEHGYLVNKPLRQCIIFATQNLITAPPFSKIDLISCRNLAIYLEPELQKKLIELYHFSLNPGGYLFIGSSEGLAAREDLFRPISKKWRIYQRLGGGRRELGNIPIIPGDRVTTSLLERRTRHTSSVNLTELNQRLLIDRYDSAGVLVDRKGKIVHLTGPIDKYLELPRGEATLDLQAVVREGLRARLRTALQTVMHEDRQVVLEHESIKKDQSYQPVKVTISPVKAPPEADGLLHVIFEDGPVPTPAQSPPAPADRKDKEAGFLQLENELKSTRDDLQNTIEELETSNEELKVANEEVLSSNEELQSTNEELETSKEELQSLNEELATLNHQLQEKVQELTQTTNDLSNLLSSTEIATVFLDTKFRIKRFTAPVAKLLNLIPTDVGRPLRHIVQNLVGVNLIEDAQAVLRKLLPIHRQVRSHDGSWYVMRVLPYRTTDNVIEGVVVTFADVTDLVAKENLLRVRERRLALVVDLGHKALARMPGERLFDVAAKRVRESLGVEAADILRLDETGANLVLNAASGWKKARVGKAKVSASGSTAPALALRSGGTVVLGATGLAKRPSLMALQRAEGFASCAYAVLKSGRNLLGVLGAQSRAKRSFAPDEVGFLKDVAQILSNAITREGIETRLKALGRTLEARVQERTSWLAGALEVARAANRAENTTEVMLRALQALCSGTGWKVGHVFLTGSDPKTPVFQCGWYPKGTERFRPFERFTRSRKLTGRVSLPAMVLQGERPVWISPAPASKSRISGEAPWTYATHLSRIHPPRAALARRLGLISAAAVPIKVGASTVGLIEIFSDLAIAPSKPLLIMMEQVAAEIGRTVERMVTQEHFSKALWQEQRAIAQELHDNVGQELTGLGAMSESILSALKQDKRVPPARIQRLTLGIQGTMEKLRSVTSGLFPVEIASDELVHALARLARYTQSRFGVLTKVEIRGRVAVESGEVATHLYRIAQEAITNAVRHARPRRILIRVEKNDGELNLTIKDDGRGIHQGSHSADGVGLRIMRHRAETIGGRLTFRSKPRSGTVVTVSVAQNGGGGTGKLEP